MVVVLHLVGHLLPVAEAVVPRAEVPHPQAAVVLPWVVVLLPAAEAVAHHLQVDQQAADHRQAAQAAEGEEAQLAEVQLEEGKHCHLFPTLQIDYVGGVTNISDSRPSSVGGAPPPRSNFGGGQYYGGGARNSYGPGSRSPSGIVPGLLIGSAIGLGAGAFLYGAYSYPYHHPYTYHNATTDKNETKPVECLCDKYSDCGCDDNGDKKYLDDIIGNGTYDGLNKSVVNVGEINGKQTIIINGTIPNDTSSDDGSSNAGIDMHSLLHTAGWWPVVATGFAIAYAV